MNPMQDVPTFPAGRYRGRPITTAPNGYIGWFAEHVTHEPVHPLVFALALHRGLIAPNGRRSWGRWRLDSGGVLTLHAHAWATRDAWASPSERSRLLSHFAAKSWMADQDLADLGSALGDLAGAEPAFAESDLCHPRAVAAAKVRS